MFFLLVLAMWGIPGEGRALAQGRDQQDYFCDDIKKPFFSETKTGTGVFETQRQRAIPGKFLMPKPAGAKRVFIIGESAALILGRWNPDRKGHAPGSGQPGNGRKAAASAVNTGGLEIINCGMGGYESYRIYGVLTEVLNYSPDLIVVFSGNNEGGEEPCPGYNFELLRRDFRLREKYFSLKTGPGTAKKEASLRRHGDMLVKMAGAAKKAGVPVIFCTLPANLEMPSAGPLPLEVETFDAGLKLFYEQNYQAALAKFLLALKIKPADSFNNFYTAKTLAKLGRTAEAKSHFLKAIEFDEVALRAGGRRNAMIREVAKSQGACMADLEKTFYTVSSGGIPGFSEFEDGMHWQRLYDKAVWEEIFRSAEKCGIKLPPWKPDAEEARPGSGTRKRLNYAVSWLGKEGLSEAALAELSDLRGKVPDLLAETAVSPEKFGKYLIDNSWTSAGQRPRAEELFPFLLLHLSETERRHGNYPAAIALCERALALKPGNKYFRLEHAQILAGLGRKKESENEFLQLSADPAFAAAATALGRSYGFTLTSVKTTPSPGGSK